MKLEHIQKALKQNNSTSLRFRETEVRLDIEKILNQKEIFWFQKSRSEWLLIGDRNTSFFHNRTMKMGRQNRIVSLKIKGNEWCHYIKIIRTNAVEYFLLLYTVDPYSIWGFIVKWSFPNQESHIVSDLFVEVNME
ncbi:hypothetical protein ES332_D05G158700v1 [Gossypium tomentosum]|uniref:Uncharacterized protein n=1 Tax=Gossypium tomentosum TaxID=34277 RepID=A0A5D2KZ13_GOSTO|nr:hypothetical protein ES332_D05G158700v1 [Gossypium tomentosum]